ncbi:MAG: hypothetical protein GX139_12960 [Armatimonadetes bacterium]|nr:hypothetical protein [Armatimonadota bacterium]
MNVYLYTLERVGKCVSLALVGVLASMAVVQGAGLEQNDPWSPMTFKDYVTVQLEKPTPTALPNEVDWAIQQRGSAERWTAIVANTYRLTQSTEKNLAALRYSRELARRPYRLAAANSARQVASPLASGRYDDQSVRDALRVCFTNVGYDAVEQAPFWHAVRGILVVSQDSSTHAKDLTESPSECLKFGNQPRIPGLLRLNERVGYARFLAPTSSVGKIDAIYRSARVDAKPYTDKLLELQKGLADLDAAPALDLDAMRELVLQGVECQVEIGAIDIQAEWDILKLIPVEYQGTWAALPPYTSIPGTKKPKAAQTGESSAGKSE